jgi:hypothetical protein
MKPPGRLLPLTTGNGEIRERPYRMSDAGPAFRFAAREGRVKKSSMAIATSDDFHRR